MYTGEAVVLLPILGIPGVGLARPLGFMGKSLNHVWWV